MVQILGKRGSGMKCDVCNGTGIFDVVWHQDENGNSEQEPIKCEKCDGFGEVAK